MAFKSFREPERMIRHKMPLASRSANLLVGHRQAGQSLVEFALVLLFVILPLVFVITDGAFTLYTYAMLTNAAREGARAGSIYQTATAQSPTQTFDDYTSQIDGERQAYARQETQRLLGNLVSLSQCSMTTTYTPDPPVMGNPFREMDAMDLRVECPRRLFFGLVGASQITLTARSTMRIEPGGVAPAP